MWVQFGVVVYRGHYVIHLVNCSTMQYSAVNFGAVQRATLVPRVSEGSGTDVAIRRELLLYILYCNVVYCAVQYNTVLCSTLQ